MKLGLITDIHEQTDHLRTALRLFRSKGVEQVVVIGDLFAMGKQIEETCRLLAEAKAVGVWGNHDYGLCVNLDDDFRRKFPPVVIEFMTPFVPDLISADVTSATLNRGSIPRIWPISGISTDHPMSTAS